MNLEFYLPADRYAVLVFQITQALRRNPSAAQEREIAVAVALMGEERIWPGDGDPKFDVDGPRLTVPFHHDLHAALLALEPDPVTGRHEPDQVKWSLGEVGDIWPESIRIGSAA